MTVARDFAPPLPASVPNAALPSTSLQYLDGLLRHAGGVMYVRDAAESRFLVVNPAFEELVGRPGRRDHRADRARPVPVRDRRGAPGQRRTGAGRWHRPDQHRVGALPRRHPAAVRVAQVRVAGPGRKALCHRWNLDRHHRAAGVRDRPPGHRGPVPRGLPARSDRPDLLRAGRRRDRGERSAGLDAGLPDRGHGRPDDQRVRPAGRVRTHRPGRSRPAGRGRRDHRYPPVPARRRSRGPGPGDQLAAPRRPGPAALVGVDGAEPDRGGTDPGRAGAGPLRDAGRGPPARPCSIRLPARPTTRPIWTAPPRKSSPRSAGTSAGSGPRWSEPRPAAGR